MPDRELAASLLRRGDTWVAKVRATGDFRREYVTPDRRDALVALRKMVEEAEIGGEAR